MTAHSHHLGHPTVYHGGLWCFEDDLTPVPLGRTEELPQIMGQPVNLTDHSRCRLCGRPPTPEGHDACLGHIPGAASACCGHGVTKGWVMMETELTP